MTSSKATTENYLGLYLWLALVAASLLLYFLFPETFAPTNIRRFFSANLVAGLGVYFLLACLRGFTLIPLTPLLVAGILVFPPWPLFIVNLGGILVSSAIVYYLARFLRFHTFFDSRYPVQMDRLTRLLDKRELPVITVWGFLPIVPTDLIVYVCSVLGISTFKTLLGVTIGEGVICAIYIFGGVAGLDLLMGT